MKKIEARQPQRIKDFFTTRPQLASYLMTKGFEGEMVANPYDRNKKAWTFSAEQTGLKDAINAYFESRQGGSING